MTTAPTRSADEQVRENSMLCAPLVTRDGLLGVLKIAARHPDNSRHTTRNWSSTFDPRPPSPFRTFIARSRFARASSMAERKHAMADLARSVSHDVNNALGAMLPLVQQLQEDLRSGTARARRAVRGPRAASEVAPGLPPDFRRHAVVLPRCGATDRIRACEGRDRHGVGNPEVRTGPERNRARAQRARQRFPPWRAARPTSSRCFSTF